MNHFDSMIRKYWQEPIRHIVYHQQSLPVEQLMRDMPRQKVTWRDRLRWKARDLRDRVCRSWAALCGKDDDRRG